MAKSARGGESASAAPRLVRVRIAVRLGFSALSLAICLSFVLNYLPSAQESPAAPGEGVPIGAISFFVAAILSMIALACLYVWLADRYLKSDGELGAGDDG